MSSVACTELGREVVELLARNRRHEVAPMDQQFARSAGADGGM
jgi:hypothetical protein